MRIRTVAAIVAAAVAAAAGSAYAAGTLAAIVGDDGKIHGCYLTSAGLLRVVEQGTTCRDGETALAWSATGDGEQGPEGPAGPVGPRGKDAPGASSIDGLLSVNATKQGQLASIPVSGYGHEIVTSSDPASGLPTGKRQHTALVITKDLDASTPRLIQALVTNEILKTVELTFRHGTTPVATVKLTNAVAKKYSAADERETWAFAYQGIEWTYGKSVATDAWQVK